jgi:hypothetical protein
VGIAAADADLWGFCGDARRPVSRLGGTPGPALAARIVDVGVAMSEENTGGAEPTPRSLADKVNWLIDWPEQPWPAVARASRSQRAYPRPEDRAADGHPPGQLLIRLPLRSSRELRTVTNETCADGSNHPYPCRLWRGDTNHRCGQVGRASQPVLRGRATCSSYRIPHRA